ncbi:MAG: HIT family protein [Gammaproteobacteria bacterium]|nr:HIT family protein [Gammaproteobacteria bacterium]
MNNCPLCAIEDETLLWQDARCRVILVSDPDYPGYCRVIWSAHIKEMTDLSEPDRAHFMRVVFAAESVLRELLQPDKINLASLGNQTPHLHWHVIPRYTDDAHFPNPIWSSRLRESAPRAAPEPRVLSQLLNARITPQPV